MLYPPAIMKEWPVVYMLRPKCRPSRSRDGGRHLFDGLEDFLVLYRHVGERLGNRLQEGDGQDQQARGNPKYLPVSCSQCFFLYSMD